MADKKKPRIRKSPPTVRQRIETANAVNQTKDKPKKVRRLASKISPFKKLRLKDRKVVKWLVMILRPIRWFFRLIIPRYFINSWREVRQVQWPARKETWRLTLAVFVFAIIFGSMVAGVDKGLDEIFKKVILK